MRFPEETVTDSFLPTFRFMLARELESRGMKESQIAATMGLSQAAISKYRLGKTRHVQAILDDPLTNKTVQELAQGLAGGGISPLQAMSLVIQLVRTHESRGLICRLHETEFPRIAGLGCNLCIVPRGGNALEEENVLSNIRAALKLLESTPAFPTLIPNVGSNVAMARKGAKDISDVAAVPGRIYEMKGAIKVPAPPEFGASRHVAGIVLGVIQADSKIRAAVNIRYSEKILEACGALGWSAVEVAGEYEGRNVDLVRKLTKSKETPQVVYHRGGYGIEPIVYLVGESALQVVENIRTLLSKTGA